MDEDDRSALSLLSLFWLVQVVCHFDAIAELRSREWPEGEGAARLLQAWQRPPSKHFEGVGV